MTFMKKLPAGFPVRHCLAMFAALACSFVPMARAGVVQFNLLGRGGAGLLATNEPGAVIGGTGGEIGAGITFDDVTRALTINVGWGSANGFTDLSSAANNSHIHGPTAGSGVAAFTQTAGVLINLPRVSSTANGGSIATTVTLTVGQAMELLAGRYYVNVHTVNNSGGEARGFLVPALFTVSTNRDGGPGSLRQAVRDVGSNGSPYTIAFATNLSGATIILTNEIVLDTSVNMDATSLAAGLTIDGGPGTNRLFSVSSGQTVALTRLTLTGGNGGGAISSGSGGAINNSGDTLTLTHCTLSGNFSDSTGGAIRNAGTLTLTRCTLMDNTSSSSGGAVFNSSSTLAMEQCTLSGNSASNGHGGAICNNLGVVTLTHCTLSGNSALTGGAIHNFAGPLTLTHSIVAGNTADSVGADIRDLDGLGVTGNGANLIGNNDYVASTFPEGPLVGTAASPKNPRLAPLASNGGPTKTMALLPGSPALDAATVLVPGLATDQRGFPIVGVPDLGAYEAGTLLDYDAWVWETFPTNATPAQRLASADYDGDGRLNATEYATLTSGSVSNAGPALVFTRNAAGTVGTNQFAIRASATDLLYQLARGTTVTNLTNIVQLNPATLTTNTYGPGLTLSSSNSTLTVTDTNLAGRPQLFYKLKVVLTP